MVIVAITGNAVNWVRDTEPTVTRDKFFNSRWKYVNSNFGSKMAAMFGGKDAQIEVTDEEQHRDKEETNYPHDL